VNGRDPCPGHRRGEGRGGALHSRQIYAAIAVPAIDRWNTRASPLANRRRGWHIEVHNVGSIALSSIRSTKSSLTPSNRSTSRPIRSVPLVIAAVLVGSLPASPPTAYVGDDNTRPGLGEYGASGPVSRDLLSEYVANRVSDRAIELAQAPALAAARASWDVEMDFVNHIYYQLRFRSQTDYLSTEPAHLGTVLKDRPKNLGIDTLGLYLTTGEAAELVRRQKLGDRIPLIRSALSESDPIVEGQEPEYGPNFAGVWQDQMDGGAIVVALVDPSLADQHKLGRIAGGKEHVRVIDVNYSWNQVQEFRDALLMAITERGVPAGVRISTTGEGRKLEVFSPDPASVTPDIVVSFRTTSCRSSRARSARRRATLTPSTRSPSSSRGYRSRSVTPAEAVPGAPTATRPRTTTSSPLATVGARLLTTTSIGRAFSKSIRPTASI
jgi:hypothetical protein